MKHTKDKKKVRRRKVESVEQPHEHVLREKKVYDSNKFFHQAQNKAPAASQTTNVNVTINPQGESCATGCFGALAQIFRRGA